MIKFSPFRGPRPRVFAVASFALLAAIGLPGCSTTMGHDVSDAQMATFKAGVTHESDVIAALGNPISSTVQPNGTKMDTYSWTKMSPTFLPGQVNSSNSSHIFRFDQNGVLLDVTSTRGGNNVNSLGL